MKGYLRRKRGPFGLTILFFIIFVASLFFISMDSTSEARRINCDPSVYDPATKTCMSVYCHSNGKGEYRPIRWDKSIPKLDCSGCHGAPPRGGQHRTAKIETCGQQCHTQSISNGFTTDFHINGIIEGIYEGEETQKRCLSCHEAPTGGRPPIGPAFQMFSNHVGGPPTDHDCIVCHMEDEQEFHQNGQIELKNHQGGPFYTLEQYNQFCLSCHDLGDSIFGQKPFSTTRPIPSIHNELVSRSVQTGKTVRFWYSHNHETGNGFDATQIINHSGPNSLLYMDNHMLMKILPGNNPDSETLTRLRVSGDPMGGGGMLTASPGLITAGVGPMIADPFISGGAAMMIAPPTAALISTPGMGIGAPSVIGGITLVSENPMMGGVLPIMADPGPMIAVSSPMIGGGINPGGGIVPASPIIAGGGMPGTGTEFMNMIIRSGPGNMVMGPGAMTLLGIDPMMGPGLFGIGMMPGSAMVYNPIMDMPGMGMLGLGIPGIGGMPGMGMPGPMMGIPWMGLMPGLGMPGTGGMPGMNMPNMGMPGTGGMPGMVIPNMNIPGMGMPNMGMPGTGGMPGMNTPNMSMPGTGGMPGMNMPGTGGMPGMPDQMSNNNQSPSHTGNPDDNNNIQPPQNQRETAACIACHTYEDSGMLEFAPIFNNLHGHFSHQNCIDCHTPHGSQFPGLLKTDINWNRQNNSCNVKSCHPIHMHNPPLGNTLISYEVRPEIMCNTTSCHIASIHKESMVMQRIRMTPIQEESVDNFNDKQR